MTKLGNWVDVPLTRPEWMQNLDGIPWHKALKPFPWHRCRAQTRGYVFGEYMERCRCGALFILDGWIERNSRR